MRRVNSAGIALIKQAEGLRLRAYLDSAGILTIGYGHTGPDVTPGKVITESEAEHLLRFDLKRARDAVDAALRRRPTDNQFSAMVSLAYNIGGGAFRASSVARFFNAGNVEAAGLAFYMWNKVRDPNTRKLKVNAGLVVRREREIKLFKQRGN